MAELEKEYSNSLKFYIEHSHPHNTNFKDSTTIFAENIQQAIELFLRWFPSCEINSIKRVY